MALRGSLLIRNFEEIVKRLPTGKQQMKKPSHFRQTNKELIQPSLGLDLDGCIDEASIFFCCLTHAWPGKVFVITYRSDRSKAESDLNYYDIRYDELILVDSFEAKGEVIKEKGILTYFDDQPEILKNIPYNVNVMLVRNGGNFDFSEKLWTLSESAGRLI